MLLVVGDRHDTKFTMITLFRPNTIYPLAQIKEVVATYIKQLPLKIALVGRPLKIFRYEFSCEAINILSWLHNQKNDTKIYWSNRDGHFEIGGIGIADCIKGDGNANYKELFACMEDRLSANNPYLRYYGGMNFDGLSCDTDWQKFGTYQFIIPQFEIFQSNRQTTFAVNIALNDINKENIKTISTHLEQIDFSFQTTYRKTPQLLSRTDFPDKRGWEAIFDVIDQDVNARKYEKIVLARKSVFDFDVSLRSDALLKHLKDKTPNCFHFCFQPDADTAFLGATPERLYKRENQDIKSEAIAGTRPRGDNSREDKELEHQLLNSAKDAHEHRYVVDAINDALKPFCSKLKADKTFSLRKLKGSQHLQTCFEGELHKDISDYQILKALHPTPAVAGSPTTTAMDAIAKTEPFNRGWYAGPVGYVGYDSTEFAVAIRSGLINQNQLVLYAGAGIVSGSTSEDEWNEIENKICNFINVFNEMIGRDVIYHVR